MPKSTSFSLNGVIYPSLLQITSQFGSFIKVQQELIDFINAYFNLNFSQFKQILSFSFRDIDPNKINTLNPHQKKWLTLGIILAIPLRYNIFNNNPISIEQYKRLSEQLSCNNYKNDIMFSFNKHEISSEKLTQLLCHMNQKVIQMKQGLYQKLDLVRLLEERIEEEALEQCKAQRLRKDRKEGEIVFRNVQMIESQIANQKQPEVFRKQQTQVHFENRPNNYLRISCLLNVILFALVLVLSS